jgi:hypothetical protein
MFKLFNEILKVFKMEKNKIYNIFDGENLKHLIRRASRRRKNSQTILYVAEVVISKFVERISKNWRSRKKKHSDRIIDIILTSLSLKGISKK